jgi:hypothetical protein
MKPRSALALLVLAALTAFVAGCGDSDSGGGSDLASLAPPGSVVYVEGDVQPSGEVKSNVDSIAQTIAGVDDLGELIVSKLEEEAEADGEPVDFEREVEPWLGERAAAIFQRLEDGELSDPIVAVESTDSAATQAFIDKRERTDGESKARMIGDTLAIADDDRQLDLAEEAAEGESLADESTFVDAYANTTEGSLADVYVDVGGLIDQGGGEIDPAAREALRNAGIDPSEATAVASLVPGADKIEFDLSSDLAGEEPPSGDASQVLGSLPADAFAAFAVSGFGEQLQEAIDNLDKEGIADTVPPNQLKKGLKEIGIDLEALADSIEDAGAFAVGRNESSLGGALVLTTKGDEGTKAIDKIGVLLRSVSVEGVTALSGKYSGFTVRNEDLGSKPIVVAAKEGRIAIGYGMPATLTGLRATSGKTLEDNPAYDEAVAALGDTPIGGFADGAAALRLADALIPASESEFEDAKPYLDSIRYLAIGSGSDGELATAKLIFGLEK